MPFAKTQFFSFWAVFEGRTLFTEDELENALFSELSSLAGDSEFKTPWDPRFSEDPTEKSFRFSFGGCAFFVVGLHRQSSRMARRLATPAIVFNLYDQFENLEKTGQYENVKLIN